VSDGIDAILARAGLAPGTQAGAARGDAPSPERVSLELLASEFESMLMVQMLRDMRRAGRWEEDPETDTDGFGATPLFEMLDAELAAQLSRTSGLGLKSQLLDAFDRVHGTPAPNEPGPTAPQAARTDVVGDRSAPGGAGAAGPGGPVVTSAFGWRHDPLTGETRFHRGVDLRAAYGQDVMAADPGRVAFSGTQGGYGTTVTLEHANGTQTRYAHLSVALVRTGDTVAAGQPVGHAGSSGRATGPHLHLERLDQEGRPMDPFGPSRNR
jgi:murein DD-endopeptidase MepM/ murein hydrolase activator NlpD